MSPWTATRNPSGISWTHRGNFYTLREKYPASEEWAPSFSRVGCVMDESSLVYLVRIFCFETHPWPREV